MPDKEPVFPVLEIWAHGYWEPWCIALVETPDWSIAIMDSWWKIKPLRWRVGDTFQWGGIQKCWERMKKVFNHQGN